jgi:broad specificity phosphatase PhoE
MRHQRVFLIRHGETEWSVNGRHAGITGISLTENGRATSRRRGAIVAKLSLAQVLTGVSDRP